MKMEEGDPASTVPEGFDYATQAQCAREYYELYGGPYGVEKISGTMVDGVSDFTYLFWKVRVIIHNSIPRVSSYK